MTTPDTSHATRRLVWMPTRVAVAALAVCAALASAGSRACRPVAWSRAVWSLLGSAQARNALLLALVAAAVVGADQLGRMARALVTVGDAQRIAGYALMRQLQAAGIGPSIGPSIGPNIGPSGAHHPAEPAHAIDPARLGAPAASSRGAPMASAASAAVGTAPNAAPYAAPNTSPDAASDASSDTRPGARPAPPAIP